MVNAYFALHALILGLYTLTVILLPINTSVLKHFQIKIRVLEAAAVSFADSPFPAFETVNAHFPVYHT